MTPIYVYILGLFLAFSVSSVLGDCTPCGKSCCTYNEACETSIKDGTCFKSSDKVTCDSLFYCYRPTTCCGFMTCCPEGSYCQGSLCYSSSDSIFDTTDSFKWYRIVGIVCGALSIVCIIIGVCVRMQRTRRARAQNPTAMGTVNSPYSTTPAAVVQPPPYTVSSTGQSYPNSGNASSPYSGTDAYNTTYSNRGFGDPVKPN